VRFADKPGVDTRRLAFGRVEMGSRLWFEGESQAEFALMRRTERVDTVPDSDAVHVVPAVCGSASTTSGAAAI
jgi:hypothetical protein